MPDVTHTAGCPGGVDLAAPPSVLVANRIVRNIDIDGTVIGLRVPIEALDPQGICTWVRCVVLDADLADMLERIESGLYGAAFRYRRAQSELALFGVGSTDAEVACT